MVLSFANKLTERRLSKTGHRGQLVVDLAHLVEDEVELCVGLLHLVALIQAEEGTAQQMLWIVHDDLEKVRNVISLIIKFWNF